MKISNLIKNDIDYIYKEITLAINNNRNKVVSAINSEMVILYWTIGKIIKIEIFPQYFVQAPQIFEYIIASDMIEILVGVGQLI